MILIYYLVLLIAINLGLFVAVVSLLMEMAGVPVDYGTTVPLEIAAFIALGMFYLERKK